MLPLSVRLFQAALMALALVVGYYHAFPMSRHAEKIDYPVTDAVTLGCLSLLVVTFLLRDISEISIGGTTVTLRETQEAATAIEETLDQAATLIEDWSTSLAVYAEGLRDAPNLAKRNRLLMEYFRDRLGEAKTFLTDTPDDAPRVALWLYREETGTIAFSYSNEFEPTRKSWDVGEGMIGKSFEEARIFNERDVRTLPCYQSTRKGDPPYRAVLTLPVSLGSTKVGMLTVDRLESERFSQVATQIAKGLAAQCAVATYLWQIFC